MSKGLEALKDIKNLVSNAELKVIDYVLLGKRYEIIEKELKALEIIKDKNVFVWGFIHRKEELKEIEYTYDYYKTHYGYFHSGYKFELLTEEEYEILKEVLL